MASRRMNFVVRPRSLRPAGSAGAQTQVQEGVLPAHRRGPPPRDGPHRPRRAGHVARPRLPAVPEMARVAGEQLVAAVSGEGDGHVLARDLRDVEGGHGGRISERLVEVPDELRQQVLNLVWHFDEPFAEPSAEPTDRKSTRLNSSHGYISYAVFCL